MSGDRFDEAIKSFLAPNLNRHRWQKLHRIGSIEETQHEQKCFRLETRVVQFFLMEFSSLLKFAF